MKLELFIVLFILPQSLCRIVEKVETACNGPCGKLKPNCPEGQRVAIRDAVYRVQDKTQTCTPFPGCSDKKQSVCCEPTPKDCVFPYSPMHLRAVLRNCSGNPECEIQTERSEVETVACSSNDPHNTSSQTALNYVCVDENKIADICSFHDAVVEGKTLFAMVDPRGKQQITKGSVCTCMAESTKWPTTNSIAVFLVDLRMNKKNSMPCSRATLSMRSGNSMKKLDCASSQDPRVNFPFVAVLNDSNVATLRLEMANHLPEFVWIGFEANEEEDIRLTCKLQGVSPNHTLTAAPPTTEGGGDVVDKGDGNNVDVNSDDESNEEKTTNDKGEEGTKERSKKPKRSGSKADAGVIVGAVLAALILILIIIVVGIVIMRRRKRYHGSTSLDDVDMDVYHSIDSTLDRPSFKSRGDNDASKNGQGVAKGRRSNKRVRIVSTPDLMEDHALPEYTSAVEVRERKRTSQRPDLTQTKSNNYDHFQDDNIHRQSDLILDSYDQLDCPPPYYSIDGLQEHRGNKAKTSSPSGQLHPNVNEAYEDTEGAISQRNSHLMEECGALYFELEKDNNKYRETVSYEGPPSIPARNSGVPDNPQPSTSASNNSTIVTPSPTPSPIYNDAISLSEDTTDSKDPEQMNSDTSESDKAETQTSPSPSTESLAQTPEVPESSASNDEPDLRKSFPIAAPRKMSRVESRYSHCDYDIAEPLEEL